MYFLDLFAGIGGFALGAKWAGMHFDGHYFSEVDDYAIKVYSKRFPDAIGLGDIKGIQGADLPAGDWIIAGGFPCQDISVAGKGAGLAGERSGLWYEYARLIGELRPRYAIMENVGALTFRGLDAVLGSLAEIGYDAEWQDIRASDVGAPHRRERIWIVAYPNCSRLEKYGAFDAMLPIGSSASRAGQEPAKADVADTTGERLERVEWQESQRPRTGFADEGQDVADTQSSGLSKRIGTGGHYLGLDGFECGGEAMAHAYRNRPHCPQRDAPEQGGDGQDNRISFRGSSWWSTEPALGCMVDGLSDGLGRFEGRTCNKMPERANQLRCLGNSIVPQIAELIFRAIGVDTARREW